MQKQGEDKKRASSISEWSEYRAEVTFPFVTSQWAEGCFSIRGACKACLETAFSNQNTIFHLFMHVGNREMYSTVVSHQLFSRTGFTGADK